MAMSRKVCTLFLGTPFLRQSVLKQPFTEYMDTSYKTEQTHPDEERTSEAKTCSQAFGQGVWAADSSLTKGENRFATSSKPRVLICEMGQMLPAFKGGCEGYQRGFRYRGH